MSPWQIVSTEAGTSQAMNQGQFRGEVDGLSGPFLRKRTNGLFVNSVWTCNCEPRLPANRLRTNNGGPNHGRWCKEPL